MAFGLLTTEHGSASLIGNTYLSYQPNDNPNRNLPGCRLFQLLAIGVSLQALRERRVVRMASGMGRMDCDLAISLHPRCLVLVEG